MSCDVRRGRSVPFCAFMNLTRRVRGPKPLFSEIFDDAITAEGMQQLAPWMSPQNKRRPHIAVGAAASLITKKHQTEQRATGKVETLREGNGR